MPDHFHALITPAPEVSLEKAMQFIKGGFSFRLKSKHDVWMRSFNESQIMTEEKFIKLCAIYRSESGAAWACDDAGELPLQLGGLWTAGPHAPPHEGLRRKGPGLKARD
jgi:hypothetical protein